MKADLTLDWDALHKLIEWHLSMGTHGIVAVGTTGESATLSMEEHSEVIRRVVEQVDGRIPVIAGTGANSLREAMELTEGAKLAGADGCLLVTPYYNKPTQEGLYQFHKAIAEAVDIPQLLYNVPGRTAVDMKPETVARLSEVKNIVGIKEATGDIERLREIVRRTPDDFLLISGDDATSLEFLKNGGTGVISVTANVAPQQFARICELVSTGDVEAAGEIDRQLEALNSALFLESNPIPVKWALSHMGLIGPGIRLPLTPLHPNYHEQVLQAMQAAGASQ